MSSLMGWGPGWPSCPLVIMWGCRKVQGVNLTALSISLAWLADRVRQNQFTLDFAIRQPFVNFFEKFSLEFDTMENSLWNCILFYLVIILVFLLVVGDSPVDF